MIQQLQKGKQPLPLDFARKRYDFAKRVIAFYKELSDGLELPVEKSVKPQ